MKLSNTQIWKWQNSQVENMNAAQNTKCHPEFDQLKSTAAFYPDESDKKDYQAVFLFAPLCSICIDIN